MPYCKISPHYSCFCMIADYTVAFHCKMAFYSFIELYENHCLVRLKVYQCVSLFSPQNNVQSKKSQTLSQCWEEIVSFFLSPLSVTPISCGLPLTGPWHHLEYSELSSDEHAKSVSRWFGHMTEFGFAIILDKLRPVQDSKNTEKRR